MRERLLASSMICGAALLGLSATQASAQESGEVSELVVTGSRIPQPNLTSASPVTVVGAEDIQTRGVTRTEDLVNQLPQVFAAQGSNYANGATGTATVDLRGLGPNRTLVLIDGRRLMNGTPAATAGNTAPDLNFIPAALIERVEVVTGGASAVYGADAVAGVVNFIMQQDFEGVRLDL
ncbi:MAG: TonB-dependent receptor, partial [Caulobacteraceae bacterium]